jgi:outer membrane protein assembly factor BamA
VKLAGCLWRSSLLPLKLRSFAPPDGWDTRPYVGVAAKIPAVRLVYLALLLGCASLLLAQARKPSKLPSPNASKLLSVKVTGSKRYTPDQIVAATGLQLGQTVSEDDFKQVSQHLGESGAFSNVAYAFQFSSEGLKVDLQVTDSGQFVAARFENFVWLSDQELFEKLRARVPLFDGQLPVAGTLADQVSDALQALAIERNLQGRVDYLRSGPQDGPMEAFDFSLTGQAIHIRNVEFPGAGSAELPSLDAAARKLSGQDYQRAILRVQAEKNFLPVYLQRGYLKAAFPDVQPKVVEDSAQETLVDVAFPVTPGRQYRLSELQLSGNKIFPAEQLRQLIHLQTGQPVNAVEVDKDIEAISKLYGTRGYMAARIQPTPEMNDAESTVKYLFQFQEGVVFKMGDLEIRGLDSRTTERVAAAWKLRGGDTYDSGYPKQFLQANNSLVPGDQWNITVHESVEEKDQTVDVSLHFDPRR